MEIKEKLIDNGVKYGLKTIEHYFLIGKWIYGVIYKNPYTDLFTIKSNFNLNQKEFKHYKDAKNVLLKNIKEMV